MWTWDDVTSRCVDAGNPGSALQDELLSVPADPNNNWGRNLRINMGAYGGTVEASVPPHNWTVLSDVTNNGIVNFGDFAYVASDWQLSADERPGDFNRNGAVDSNDITLFAQDWLEQTLWHEK